MNASSSRQKSNGDYYQAGDVIDKRFKVVEKLGQGGYSQVYKVQVLKNSLDDQICQPQIRLNPSPGINFGGGEGLSNMKSFINSELMQEGDNFALKVEKVNILTHRLKSEAAILQKLSGKMHFTNIYGFGNNGISSYMVQSLCGMDLHEMVKIRNYSGVPTELTCQLLIQMLQALEEFHQIGYLHRDIKPSNFVIRCDSPIDASNIQRLPDDALICLIDFGVARRFMNPDGSIRPARQDGIPRFRGTNRYSSIRNYVSQELGRCDDMISLYYSIIEISCPGGLPWRNVSDKIITCRLKRQYNPEKQHISLKCPFLAKLLQLFYSEMKESGYKDDILYGKYIEGAENVLESLYQVNSGEE